MSSNLPAPGLGALDETRQCEQLVSGERCVLVLNHRGVCVKPVPRWDPSDVIRYRLLADKYAVAQETIDAQAARLAAAEAERDQALDAMNAEWAEAFSKESWKLNNWVSQCSDENEALRARLAAVEAERDRYRKRLDQLTDDSLLEGLSDTDLERYGQSSPQEIYRWLLDAEARLAAVSDALMYAISIICNIEHPTVTQDVPWEPLRRRFLDQAHAALGPPAAETAPRTEAPGTPPAEGAHG